MMAYGWSCTCALESHGHVAAEVGYHGIILLHSPKVDEARDQEGLGRRHQCPWSMQKGAGWVVGGETGR